MSAVTGGSGSGQTKHEICKLSEVGERSINICMNTLVQTVSHRNTPEIIFEVIKIIFY